MIIGFQDNNKIITEYDYQKGRLAVAKAGYSQNGPRGASTGE